jgi:hypothetical protein
MEAVEAGQAVDRSSSPPTFLDDSGTPLPHYRAAGPNWVAGASLS